MSARDSHHSVRPSPIFWAIVGLTLLGGGLAYWDGAALGKLAYVAVFIFVIAGWVVSLCLHEFGHAVTAWRFGDRDIAVRGYLDLDPRRYSHPVLSLVLPILITALGGIGLPGAAVYVRTSFMTARQRTLVSLAGPAANLVLAALLLALTSLYFDPLHPVLWAGVAFLGFLQITAVLLNLLPIPGLDGYSALEPHLSPETQRALEPFKPYGVMILLLIFFAPVLNRWFFGMVFWFFELSGVPAVLANAGMQLTRFWNAWF
ncbi:MAG TPA: site-2 protease family protein [Mycobacterium sp.]